MYNNTHIINIRLNLLLCCGRCIYWCLFMFMFNFSQLLVEKLWVDKMNGLTNWFWHGFPKWCPLVHARDPNGEDVKLYATFLTDVTLHIVVVVGYCVNVHTHSMFFRTSWCTLICCRFFYARYNKLQPINTLLFRGWCIIII
jgi:hypothetical protein